MLDEIRSLIAELGREVCDVEEVPPRNEVRSRLPMSILSGPAGELAKNEYPDGTVWAHQAKALEVLSDGDNLVMSTGTASGKSLVFQLYALHKLIGAQENKVLVLYPLRALANDQEISWKALATKAGLGAGAVDRIYGGVSMEDRERIVKQARIVLMTPDVCHAWLMRKLDDANVQEFVKSLILLVLDEAHVYESVFGSNTAFLVRRLLTAKRRLQRGERARRLQIIASTATIENPVQHMMQLTGAEFSVVDESENGAPRSSRHILHMEGPDSGVEGEKVIGELLGRISQFAERRRFIAFVDSRQGVERITRSLEMDTVKPYRSGYEGKDRVAIERALRQGELAGVVTTSALELGIDIADMDIGLNLGVPQSRKSFRQRLGRIGRRGPGIFIVVAPKNAFTKYGYHLSTYYAQSVEPSYLYLGNRFLQFAQARCLTDETEALGSSPAEATSGVVWPEGFPEVQQFARSGYPREFDKIAQIGGDGPHWNYPLRQLGETKVVLQEGGREFGSEIGDMSYHQAIREAYPGATYLHMTNPYKVAQWEQGFNKNLIHIRKSRNPAPTRPILRKSVTIDLSIDGIIPGRVLKANSGLIAEAHIQVNEAVEGFAVGGTQFLYRDLRANDPNMRRKQRDFRTTGVVIQIEEGWFADSSIRREIAGGLRDLLARDRSIAPQDIDSAHTNIALLKGGSLIRPIKDIVVIYDSVYGGLRLTETLFEAFGEYAQQLGAGADLSGGEGLVSQDSAIQLAEWYSRLLTNLYDYRGEGTGSDNVPEGWLRVFKPGSIVGLYVRGELVERELINPRLMGDGDGALFYSYIDPRMNNGNAYTPSDNIEPVGHDWDWVLWNPETGEIAELEGGD